MKRGKFITFEGSEGCGKSTQSKLLYGYLKDKGLDVVVMREPGGVKISEKIRKLLLDVNNDSISPVCEMLLYMAARAQVVDKLIKPALRKGKIVICDRFLDSTIAYQGFGLGLDIKAIRFIGNIATQGIKPDLTIFLDLAVKKGLQHRKHSLDRIEKRALSYHRRVRNGYFKLAASEPRRIKIAKVEKDLDLTQKRVRELVEKYVF
jgi:dTMP kinase